MKEHVEHRSHLQAAVGKEEGTKHQEIDPQNGGSCHSSIRRLLCDNVTCAICDRAAKEAEEVLRVYGSKPGLPALQMPSLPVASYVGSSSLPAISAQRDDTIFPWSSSKPATNCGHPELGPETTPSSRKEQHIPKGKRQKEKPLHSAQQDVPISRENDISPSCSDSHSMFSINKCYDSSEDSSGEMSDPFCFSSSTSSELSFNSWEDYSPLSDLSELSNFSKKSHMPLRHKKNEGSSLSERKNHQGMRFHHKGTRHFPSSLPVISQANIKSPRVEFATEDTAFVAKAVRKTLEWHLVVKSIQHKLGLPSVVLRSLRAFLPLGMDFTCPYRPKREHTVLMRPRLLPFMSGAKRRTLEKHMKKMIHMQCRVLPKQVQEALKHMKLDYPLTTDIASSAHRKGGRGGVVKGEREGKLHRHVLHLESTARETALKSPPPSKANPQTTTEKKSFEARHEMLLQSQHTVAFVQARTSFLPANEKQSLDSHVLKKKVQHPWDQPTLIQEIPFIEQGTWEDLEWHVIKKRLQHAWGLPSLVQRSLHSVFPIVPQSQQHRTLQHVEVNVLLAELSFLSDAIIQELEQNLLKRIMLHRWHLPPRVLESLRLLSPEMVTVAGKQDGTRIGRRTMPSQPLMYPTLQSEAAENKIFHLDEKWLDVFPTLAMSAMKPKLLPTFPRAREVAVEFLEVRTEFLYAQVRENLELHIRKKKLQHEWGLPSLIQKSLHGFKSQAPPLPSLQRTKAHVYILLQKPSFLPQSTYSQLDFHIQRMKLQRQWKLPKRVLESIKLFRPVFGTGPLEPQITEYQNKSCDSLGRFSSPIPVAREELAEARQAMFVGENIFTHGPKAYRAQQMVRPHQDMEAGEVPEGAFSESSAASTDHPSLRRKSTESDLQPMGSFKITLEDSLQKFTPLYSQVKPRSTFLPFVEGEAVDKVELNIRHEFPEHQPSQQSEILNRKDAIARAAVEDHYFYCPCYWITYKHPGFSTVHQEVSNRKTFGLMPASPQSAQVLSMLKPHSLDKMNHHLAKKHREMQLRDIPNVATSSSTREHFTFLGELPSMHLEPLATVFQERCSSSQISQVKIRVQELEPPIFQNEARELLMTRSPRPEGSGSSETSATRASNIRLPKHSNMNLLEDHLKKKNMEAKFQLTEVFQEPVSTFLTKEACDLLELHIQRKRLQHEWGLPSLVQKSLHAFVPLPPELQRSKKAGASTHVTVEKLGYQEKATVHVPHSVLEAIPPQKALHVVSPDVKNGLEAHVRSWAMEHQWGLPKLIQDSLRAIAPTQLESHFKEEKHHTPLSEDHRKSYEQDEIPTLSEGREPLKQLTPKAGARGHPKATIHQGHGVATTGTGVELTTFESSEMKPPLLTEEAWNLLEFHIGKKKIQHMWGLPSTVLKSLCAFALFPPDPENHRGENITNIHPWDWVEVRTIISNLAFISSDIKERLEAHMRNITTKHRWEIPKRVQESLRAFQRPRSLPQSELDPLSCQYKSSQGHTKGSQTDDDNEHSSEDAKRRVKGKQERAGTVPSNFKVTAFLSLEVNLNFLTRVTQDLLEFHIQHKKIQHAWGLPSSVLRSLKAFGPYPLEMQMRHTGRNMTTAAQCNWMEVQVIIPSLSFLSPNTKEHLEAHMRKRVVQHRWGLPKRVQQSLGGLLHHRQPFRSGKDNVRPYPSKFFQVPAADSQTEDDKEDLVKEEMGNRRTAGKGWGFPQGKQGATTAVNFEETTFLWPGAKLAFLTDEAQDLLEFHIRQKKLQHTWGLPSSVLKSMHAFAPFLHGSQTHVQNLDKRMTKANQWVKVEVKEIVWDLFFPSPDTKDRLEAHERRRVAKHRWGLPMRVQQSLGVFLHPRHALGLELENAQYFSPSHYKSSQVARDYSETEGDNEDMKDSMVKRRTIRNMEAFNQLKQGADSTMNLNVTAFLWPGVKLGFLTNETWEFLEFHILRKKLHHAWGLPSNVLKSLHAFAPFHLETEKHKQSMTMRYPWEIEEAHIISRSLTFLSQDLQENLDAHVRRMTTHHRWQLPEQVSQSLRAFRNPRVFSQCELGEARSLTPFHGKFLQEHTVDSQSEDENEVLVEEEMDNRRTAAGKGWVVPQGKEGVTLQSNFKVSALSSLEVNLNFLTRVTQDLLEFHIQHKKIQHAWGLPSSVLKSLKAFGPYPLEIQKQMQHTRRNMTTAMQCNGMEVQVVIPSLSFLSPNTKGHLEAHMRKRVVQHRWGLPKRVQQSLGGFLLPRQPFGSRQDNVQPSLGKFFQVPTADSQTEDDNEDLVKEEMGNRRTAGKGWGFPQGKQGATTALNFEETTFLWPGAKLAFLTDEAQDLLEFHIRQKKLQHTWGLPFSVLKSMHAFAPFLHGSQTHVQNLDKRMTKANQWVKVEVKEIVWDLFFPSPDTKDRLEAHERRRVAKHRWGLPMRVQQSLGVFLHPRHALGLELENAQDFSPHYKSSQVVRDSSETEGDNEDTKDSMVKRRTIRNMEAFNQLKQGADSTMNLNVTAFLWPGVKLGFLTNETWEFLEFHILRKKLHHAWGRPSNVLKSLHAFAPFHLETEKHKQSMTMRYPWEKEEAHIISRSLTFLSQDLQENLDAHVRRMTRHHRWHLPEQVSQSLRAFRHLRPFPQCELGEARSLTPFHGKFPQEPEADSHSEEDKEDLVKEEMGNRRTGEKGWGFPQGKQGATTTVNFEETYFLWPPVKLAFLTDETQDLLEFHIRQKKLQHTWGLPFSVLKSIHAFAPILHESQTHVQSLGKRMTKAHQGDKVEVKEIVWDPFFPSPDTKDRLEAHERRRVAKHRWGLPMRVQQSLGVFLHPRHALGLESENAQYFSPHYKSSQVARDYSETEGDNEDMKEFKVKRRTTEKMEVFNQLKQGADSTMNLNVTAFLWPGVKLGFLTNETWEFLEFHILRKKLHHAWGLPSNVLKSLHAFAPFHLETEKHKQSMTMRYPWEKEEAHIISRSPTFLSQELQENLDAHVRRMTRHHWWHLPEQVSQSLRAFRNPRAFSQCELGEARSLIPFHRKFSQEPDADTHSEDDKEDLLEDAKVRKKAIEKLERRLNYVQKAAATPVLAQATTFLLPEVTLPFLTDETHNLLESHIQHKKLHHAWGLPSSVLKSLHAFAPFLIESEKHPPYMEGENIANGVSWDRGEVYIITPTLSFLSPDTTECLDAHVRSMTAKHRWGLPKHAQNMLRAFLLPVSHQFEEIRPQTHPHNSTFYQDSHTQLLGESEEERLLARTSSITHFIDCVAELPFLTDGAQDVLEVHIQHKKIQHQWGLPAIIQKSVRAFAPPPLEPQESPQTSVGVSTAGRRQNNFIDEWRAGAKEWPAATEVPVSSQHSHFLHSKSKEHLEKHTKKLNIEHQWHLPKLAQKLTRDFSPEVDEMEEEPLTYSGTQTLQVPNTPFQTGAEKEASSGSEDQPTYTSELFWKIQHRMVSWPDAEKDSESLYPLTKVQHFTVIQGTSSSSEGEREAPQVSALQIFTLNLHHAAQYPQIPGKTEESCEIFNCPCSCHSSTSTKGSASSLQLVAEQRWRQEQQENSQENGKETEEGSFSQISENNGPQDSVSFPGKSRKDPSISKEAEVDFSVQTSANIECQDSDSSSGDRDKNTSLSKEGKADSSSQLSLNTKLQIHSSSSGDNKDPSLSQEAEADATPQISHNIESQVSGSSLGEHMKDASLSEHEFSQAYFGPLKADDTQQYNTLVSQQALDPTTQPSHTLDSQCFHEHVVDPVHYSQADQQHQAEWDKQSCDSEERKQIANQIIEDTATSSDKGGQAPGQLKGWSSESPCCNLKPPPPTPKSEDHVEHQGIQVSENRETSSEDSQDDEQSNQQVSHLSQNQDSANTEVEFQMQPTDGSLLQTSDDMGKEREEGGAYSSSEYSTECELERVGDWDGGEVIGEESSCVRKEEGVSSEDAEEMPMVEPRSLKYADSLTAGAPQVSPEDVVPSSETSDERDSLSKTKVFDVARQAVSEQFEHLRTPQSVADEMTEALELSRPLSVSHKRVAFWEENHDFEQTEILGNDREGEGNTGGEASTIDPEGGKHQGAGRKDEEEERGEAGEVRDGGGEVRDGEGEVRDRNGEEILGGRRKASHKETIGEKELSTKHESKQVAKTTRGEEAPRLEQRMDKQPVQKGSHPHSVGGISSKHTVKTDGKLSILGKILERKMHLRDGMNIWMQNTEKPGVISEGKSKKGGHATSGMGKHPGESQRERKDLAQSKFRKKSERKMTQSMLYKRKQSGGAGETRLLEKREGRSVQWDHESKPRKGRTSFRSWKQSIMSRLRGSSRDKKSSSGSRSRSSSREPRSSSRTRSRASSRNLRFSSWSRSRGSSKGRNSSSRSRSRGRSKDPSSSSRNPRLSSRSRNRSSSKDPSSSSRSSRNLKSPESTGTSSKDGAAVE
ncbi:uncharacterized protein LOC128400584 isoform X2 [Podarcis raffonei]|uniref:uncharacterized protein LOC128400584 isoform X2 n=1 Tax=Podarcis raffonei TaxID=65483 RepID=UPI00232983D7|nr:uncharacterized protein LOC128400584 isoform X2 [Podarcis raffonei]